MSHTPSMVPPDVFKGIALFTPGGDVIYCIDPEKHRRWHLQLCIALKDFIALPDIPHFLVPCYAATVDRWWDSRTQRLNIVAEASPRLRRYEPLLNVLFGLERGPWTYPPRAGQLCDPALLSTYRAQFPTLWENHNLVIYYNQLEADRAAASVAHGPEAPSLPEDEDGSQGIVLRLFVSGYGAPTEAILRRLHHALEQTLKEPYTLKVVDISRNPEQAEIDHITATPTLLRVWPKPSKRIVGHLDNVSQFISLLSQKT